MMTIIGLGNPGVKYMKNRHNAGVMFCDFLRSQSSNLNLKILTSNVFMNNSGKFVKKMVRTYNLEPSNLYVAHDDLDLKLGTYKIQFGVGPKIHYGIQSVENELGTKEFWRVRIGVDNRPTSSRSSGTSRAKGEDYVLEDFTDEEFEILKQIQDDIKKDLYEKIGKDLAGL